MINISQAASLALHAMAILAAESPNSCTTAELAKRLDASAAHLSKIMQRLRKAGLVEASRGPSGGFWLSRPAEEITLLEAYEAIEGRLNEKSCLMHNPVCRGHGCIFADLLGDLGKQVRDYLSSTTLADVEQLI